MKKKKIEYSVRFNKKSGKYELFKTFKRNALARALTGFMFRDVAVADKNVVIDYNVVAIGSRGYMQEYQQKNEYGFSCDISNFLADYIENLGLEVIQTEAGPSLKEYSEEECLGFLATISEIEAEKERQHKEAIARAKGTSRGKIMTHIQRKIEEGLEDDKEDYSNSDNESEFTK